MSRALLAVFWIFLGCLVATQTVSAANVQQPPMQLPADAGISSGSGGGEADSWIVGGVPGERTAGIARRSGAHAIDRSLGSYRVARAGARRFASRLRRAGVLVHAEPDVAATRAGYPLDLLIDQQWWLNRIVNPADVTPPPVTSESPMIAIVEESLDRLHPDLIDANLTGASSLGPAADWHGTAIAGIIGSPGEMRGIRGVWPGARMRLFPSGLKCSTASRAVARAADAGAAVINMSYTFPAGRCFTHFRATQYAVRKGAIPVAAAGNSGAIGNAPMRPAVDPHVISVGAVDNNLIAAPFSTRNAGVDITAPGAGVLAPVVARNPDGTSTSDVIRGWSALSGTSFSAPMVSATAAWLAQVRPDLGNLQIARLLTDSATDLGAPGRDPIYGAGLLSIEHSLAARTPPLDPFEPNDDIRWVDGSLIGVRSPVLWRPGLGPRRAISATLSRAKDPADVYRVMIPARSKIVVNVNQVEGDVVLSAFRPRTRTIFRPGKNLIVRSNRPYPKTEGILVRNRRKKPQLVWLAVTPSPGQTGNDMGYRLTVARR